MSAIHNIKGAFHANTVFTVIYAADTDFEMKSIFYEWNGNSGMMYMFLGFLFS